MNMRIKRSVFIAIAMVCFVLLIAGCNRKQPVDKVSNEVFLEYSELIKNNFQKEIEQHITSFSIAYTKDSIYGDLSYVLFASDKDKFEGSVLVDKSHKKVLYQAINKVDDSVPFTKLEMSGLINKKGRYHIVSGYINDKDISNIIIKFSSGLVINNNKSDLNTYSYVYIDEPEGNIVVGVEGINNDGKKIFAY